MSFSIRTAERADWETVRQLLDESGLPISDLDDARMGEFLLAETPRGDLLGSIGIERYGDHALLRSLAISPPSRHGGIGRALVERLEARAERRGVREVWLLTNDAADFFTRLGYLVRARKDAPGPICDSREFSVLCPDTAILMSRPLVP